VSAVVGVKPKTKLINNSVPRIDITQIMGRGDFSKYQCGYQAFLKPQIKTNQWPFVLEFIIFEFGFLVSIGKHQSVLIIFAHTVAD